jgi:hypothetical protein
MARIGSLLLASAAVLAAIRADAQMVAQEPRPDRPYRGVFAGRVGQTEQLLVVTGDIGGGYDTNVNSGVEGGDLNAPVLTGAGSSYGTVSGGAAYSLTRSRVSFAASGASGANVYFHLTDHILASHAGSVGASFELSRRTRVSGNQSFGYQPLSSFGLFPALGDPVLGQTPPIDASFGAIGESYFHYGTDVSLTQALSNKAGVTVSFMRSKSDFPTDDWDAVTQFVKGTFSRNVARGLDLRLGYGYGAGEYGTDDSEEEEDTPHGHMIEAGVDFNRALSFSRRTRLSFGTGSTAVKDSGETRYYVTGNARLIREVGRSWDAAVAYSRNVEFIDTLREPVFSDSVNVGVGGLIGRRVDFQANAGLAFGEVGVNEADDFESVYAMSGLSIALNRYSALSFDYYLYRYDFADSEVLLPGMPPEVTRQSVRASISLWAPVFVRSGRRNATR